MNFLSTRGTIYRGYKWVWAFPNTWAMMVLARFSDSSSILLCIYFYKKNSSVKYIFINVRSERKCKIFEGFFYIYITWTYKL